jgi:hypothetical protein
MKAPLSLLVLALAACGGGGDDDGVVAVDSALPAELTGEDILDKLLEVDGEGSGLDSDTIDGLDGADLARTTRRIVDVQASSLDITNDPDPPALVNAGSPIMNLWVRVPPDAADAAAYELHLLAGVTGAPCGVHLTPFAIQDDGEGGTGGIPGAFTDNDIVVFAEAGRHELTAQFAENDSTFKRGDWIAFSVTRASGNGQDTCGDMTIDAVAIEYDGR